MIVCASPVGARPERDPLIGVGARLRHARLQLNERTADPRSALAHVPVGDALRHWRIPGTQKVSAEREDVPCVGEIEGRKLSLAEAQKIRVAQHLVAEQLERNGGLGSESREEL